MASDNTISASMPRASASKPETKHSFYGSFPRELRDKIYDLIISEKEQTFNGACFKMRSTVPKVRLLCKQFKKEYDERCPKLNHLEIFNCYIDSPSTYSYLLQPDPVPPLAIRATSLRYHWIWCDDEPDFEPDFEDPCGQGESVPTLWRQYGRQINKYVKPLPDLAKFDLIISCSTLTCVLAITALDGACGHDGYIRGNPRMSLLRPVYDSETGKKRLRESVEGWGTGNPHSGPFFEDRETMATWSYKEGWKVDEEVIEKCRQEEARWLSSRPQEGKTPS